jgi:adenylate cyclase
MHDQDGLLISWASDRPGGFTPEEREAIARIEKHSALALKMALRERITLNTLNAYLGENAASRVLKGSIKLGDGEIIPAVIWYSDLRKSTNLGDTLPGPELLSTLNDYFSCTAGAVMDHGGEVLRFVGDAVLAIFPSQEMGMKQACTKATEAAIDAISRMETVNRKRFDEGKERLEFGLGLHAGELMFGNIGITERMEFSVTGPCANEAARIENMTKEVGSPVLASKEFANHVSDFWSHKGAYPLRGIERSLELFTLNLPK